MSLWRSPAELLAYKVAMKFSIRRLPRPCPSDQEDFRTSGGSRTLRKTSFEPAAYASSATDVYDMNVLVGQLTTRREALYYTHTHKSSETLGFILRATRSDKGHRRSQWVELACENCGTQFERRISQTKNRAFCSRECWQTSDAPGEAGTKGGGRPRTKTLTPGLHPNRPTELFTASTKYGIPTGWTNSQGYVVYTWPSHPDSKDNRITEQRAVAYEHMGDVLNGHHILHIDGDPTNNVWHNLLVRNPSETTPKSEGIILWQGFYQWASQHSPEAVERYQQATAN